jgi:hypothetical protein
MFAMTKNWFYKGLNLYANKEAVRKRLLLSENNLLLSSVGANLVYQSTLYS